MKWCFMLCVSIIVVGCSGRIEKMDMPQEAAPVRPQLSEPYPVSDLHDAIQRAHLIFLRNPFYGIPEIRYLLSPEECAMVTNALKNATINTHFDPAFYGDWGWPPCFEFVDENHKSIFEIDASAFLEKTPAGKAGLSFILSPEDKEKLRMFLDRILTQGKAVSFPSVLDEIESVERIALHDKENRSYFPFSNNDFVIAKEILKTGVYSTNLRELYVPGFLGRGRIRLECTDPAGRVVLVLCPENFFVSRENRYRVYLAEESRKYLFYLLGKYTNRGDFWEEIFILNNRVLQLE